MSAFSLCPLALPPLVMLQCPQLNLWIIHCNPLNTHNLFGCCCLNFCSICTAFLPDGSVQTHEPNNGLISSCSPVIVCFTILDSSQYLKEIFFKLDGSSCMCGSLNSILPLFLKLLQTRNGYSWHSPFSNVNNNNCSQTTNSSCTSYSSVRACSPSYTILSSPALS